MELHSLLPCRGSRDRDQTGLRTQSFIRGKGADLRAKGQWELSTSGVEEGLPDGEPMRQQGRGTAITSTNRRQGRGEHSGESPYKEKRAVGLGIANITCGTNMGLQLLMGETTVFRGVSLLDPGSPQLGSAASSSHTVPQSLQAPGVTCPEPHI